MASDRCQPELWSDVHPKAQGIASASDSPRGPCLTPPTDSTSLSTVGRGQIAASVKAQNPRMLMGPKDISSNLFETRRGAGLACDHTVAQLEPDPRSSDFYPSAKNPRAARYSGKRTVLGFQVSF